MSANLPLFITFVAYLLLILGVGIRAYQQTDNLADYILGGRRLGPVVAALSVGASDMSGWLLLGLPGAIYLSGLSEAWIGIGLLIGAYLNWSYVAKPLRIASHAANNALTLPDYFETRFGDKTRLLRVFSAVIILLFFTFYTASGLVGGAILFEGTFGIDYYLALAVGAVIIVSYTFVVGFLAVSWTDAIQAILMLAALIVTPIVVIYELGGIGTTIELVSQVNPDNTRWLSGLSAIGVISLLGWGLGYVGQPHILARFMAIKDPEKLVSAKRIAMSWMFIALLGTLCTGAAGIAFFSNQALDNPETVFIVLTQTLFNPWVAGVVAAAILSAIMSTIDSQLLVSSSVISEDFYRVFIRPNASEKELLKVGRIAVIIIALVAIAIASDRDSRVLDLVSYAWAGFGASFGPVIIFSLFWSRMTAAAALCGMTTGALTVVIWSGLNGGIYDLYEIIPGFVLASLVIMLVSYWKPQTSEQVIADFGEVRELCASK